MKRIVSIFLTALFIALLFAGCGSQKARNAPVSSLAELDQPGRIVGVAVGTSAATSAPGILENAEISYINSLADALAAVGTGKVDAFAFDRISLEYAMINGIENCRILDEPFGEPMRISVGISRRTRIDLFREKLNAFIEQIHSDGTMDDIYMRWVTKGLETMPDIPEVKDPSCHLIVATSGTLPPSSYHKGDELIGFDIELARRFAYSINASLEFREYNYAGMIAAAETGEIDCIFALLNETPERKEVIDFSDPVLLLDNVLLVKDEDNVRPVSYQNVASLNTPSAKVGIITGMVFEPIYETHTPKAGISYYNSLADLIYALSIGQLDGFALDTPVARYIAAANPGLTCLDEELTPLYDYGFPFADSEFGEKLQTEMNEFLAAARSDGTMDALFSLWYGSDDEKQVVELPTEGENGVIRVAVCSDNPPLIYIKDNAIVGLEIDILAHFCREYGYGMELSDMNFGAILPGISSGRYDAAAGFIAVTEERKETIRFSDPYSTSGFLMVVREETAQEGFFDRIASSFEKTFIREGRWKLILSGLKVTAYISVLSAFFGTLLGFGICLLRRTGSRFLFSATSVYIRILQGTPLVVLLMILFYIVFAKSGLSGEWVAVVTFSLNFAAYVSEIVRSGLEAIDKGQTEAALALGYTRSQAFFSIVLPQAAGKFLPVYKGEFISMVKMTSIVGYIAVQDLTKVSDIIRSRTYEAFFPLIVTALIYFLLANLLTLLLGALEWKLEPKRKNRTVKGVEM